MHFSAGGAAGQVPAVPHELQVGDDRGDGVGLRRGPGFHRHGDRGVHRIRPDRLQDRQSPRTFLRLLSIKTSLKNEKTQTCMGIEQNSGRKNKEESLA